MQIYAQVTYNLSPINLPNFYENMHACHSPFFPGHRLRPCFYGVDGRPCKEEGESFGWTASIYPSQPGYCFPGAYLTLFYRSARIIIKFNIDLSVLIRHM